MLGRLFAPLENLVLAHSRAVLAVAALLVVAAAWLGSGVEVRTSTRDMVPRDEPAQVRWDALRADFRDPEPLMVLIEGDVDDPALRAAADAAATALGTIAEAHHVYHRIDARWIVDHALWLVPPATLAQSLAAVRELLGDDDVTIDSLADLDERVAARLERGLAESAAPPAAAAGEPLERLTDLLRQQRRLLEDPAAVIAELEGDIDEQLLSAGSPESIDRAGYLRTADGTYLILANTESTARDRAADMRFVAAARVAIEAALREHPGVTAEFTGAPALTADEVAAIRRDGLMTSAIAIAGVTLLAGLAFHRRRHAALGLMTLGAGVIWSLGAVRLELGYLNVITTALVPILVGIGIDYAIHPLSQYELERLQGRSGEDAVRATFRKTVAAVVVSAVTTAVAFFSFLLMEFRGFSELGLVTGVGVLLCLAASLLVLPALLVRFGASAGDDARRAPTVDRLWTDRFAAALCSRPVPVLLLATVLTLGAIFAAPAVQVRTGLVDLLPTSAESLRRLETIDRDPNFAAYFNMVAADDVASLQRAATAASAEPTIARFDSLLRFLPQDADATAPLLRELSGLLGRLQVVPGPWPGEAAMASALQRLEAALAAAADAAFVTGRGELAGALERARAEAQAAAAALDEPTAQRRADWEKAHTALLSRGGAVLQRVRSMLDVPAPGIDDIPAQVRDRLLTTSGRLLAYLIPTGDVFDSAFLAEFNLASARVDAGATGFPLVFEAHSRMITSGFSRALLVGGLLMLAILLLDLRQPSAALLAALPVAIGTIWLLGLMAVLGLSFNLANLIAVPLVIGVGIDNGVHLVHRYRLERHLGVPAVLAHTGRAILIASLTTMVGFGSLTLASHRGMAGLGLLLLIGVGACLLASIVVLPNLLVLIERASRRRAQPR